MLCVEAPTSPAGAAWVLGLCAANAVNQKFVYNPFTRVLARWDSRNLCLDSSVGKTTGTNTVSTDTCQLVGGTNQQFEVTAVAASAVTTGTATMLSTLALAARTVFLSQTFVPRSLYKTDLCLDDGGSALATGVDMLSLAQCTLTVSQRFARRLVSGEIQSATKPSLCLSLTTDAFVLTYRACGSQKLTLSFTASTFQLQRASSSSAYCVQDATVSPWAPSATSGLSLAACDTTLVSQRFFPQALTTPPLAPLFMAQANFTLCLNATPVLCLSDGGRATSTISGLRLKMMPKTKPSYRGANVFVYDKDSRHVMSAAKPTLCVEAVGTTAWTLATCSATSASQQFVYDTYTRLLARYDGRDKCMDTTLGATLGTQVVSTATCPGDGTATQQFVLGATV